MMLESCEQRRFPKEQMERLRHREPEDFLNFIVNQHFECQEENSRFFGGWREKSASSGGGHGAGKSPFCLMPALSYQGFNILR